MCLIVRTDIITMYDIIYFNIEVLLKIIAFSTVGLVLRILFQKVPYILLRYVTGRFAFILHI